MHSIISFDNRPNLAYSYSGICTHHISSAPIVFCSRGSSSHCLFFLFLPCVTNNLRTQAATTPVSADRTAADVRCGCHA